MKKIAIIVLIVLLCISSIMYFFWPMPIVKNVESAEIASIILHFYDSETNQEASMLIDDYDKGQILDYLSTCREQRSLFAFNPKPIGENEIEIMIYSANSFRHIILGSINVGYNGNWIKYKILNAEEVKSELKDLLDYDSRSA